MSCASSFGGFSFNDDQDDVNTRSDDLPLNHPVLLATKTERLFLATDWIGYIRLALSRYRRRLEGGHGGKEPGKEGKYVSVTYDITCNVMRGVCDRQYLIERMRLDRPTALPSRHHHLFTADQDA